jgi:phosphatidate phosphatase APP1
VPVIPASSSNCLVRVTLKGADKKKLAQGLSEGIFSITVPVVKVTATLTNPTGGTKFKVDDTVSITWSTTGSGISSIDLEYTSDGGKNWSKIITNTTNSGKYSWKIPNVSSTSCYVKVTARDKDKAILSSDQNDAPFTLESKGIHLFFQAVPFKGTK